LVQPRPPKCSPGHVIVWLIHILAQIDFGENMIGKNMLRASVFRQLDRDKPAA